MKTFRKPILLVILFFTIGHSSGQIDEGEYKYRYTIADFNEDGFTDTLLLKSFRSMPYDWTIHAIDGRTSKRYCLFSSPGKYCASFLYYLPIPNQFYGSPAFKDSLYTYAFPTALRIDTLTPEIEWLIRMWESNSVKEHASDRDYRCASPEVVWIDEAPRTPVHTITEVNSDSNFTRLGICDCGTYPTPSFSHQKGWLVYSAIHHRKPEHWDNPENAWIPIDSGGNLNFLYSCHGVIVTTDTSYAWLFHTSAPLAPLGYLGIRQCLKLVHREGNKLFIHMRPGVTDPEVLFIVDILSGKICRTDICTLVNCYNSDICSVDIEIRDGIMTFVGVEIEQEKWMNVELPLDEVVRMVWQ